MKIFLIGNPNTGKTTLFNSLTKSDEHTGNFHGVTVDEKMKKINFKGEELEFYDLPGLYSLNAFSFEEEVTIKRLFEDEDAHIICLADANTLKRCLYLISQIIMLRRKIVVFVNNMDNLKRGGGNIDLNRLSDEFGVKFLDINAKTIRLNPSLLKEIKNAKISTKFDIENYLNEDKSFSQDENIEKSDESNAQNNKLNISQIDIKNISPEKLYRDIEKIVGMAENERAKNLVYGKSKLDSAILKMSVFLPAFLVVVFLILYLTFFLVGPRLSSLISFLIEQFIEEPILFFLTRINSPTFIFKLFDEGVFSAGLTICSFLPQICLLYLFLGILEDSGLISRMAFMFDDFLNKLGLNGRCIYSMLLGFGCNTSAVYTSKNMPDKNSKTKTALIIPNMSCTAKLPIYMVIGTAIFGVKNIFVVIGLYLLGVVVSILLALFYEHSFFKSRSDSFIIEFPPLKAPNLKRVLKLSLSSSKQFLSKVFGVIFSMSIVLWVLTNVDMRFRFTGDATQSILFSFSNIMSPLFKPLGLDNPAIICALFIGLVAKELVVSTMLILNHVSSTAGLVASLKLSNSAITFSIPSAISFLIFVLLYAPCISTTAVLLKELGRRNTILGLAIQFLTAFSISAIAYNLMTQNYLLVAAFVSLMLIMFITLKFLSKKHSIQKLNLNCQKCPNNSRCKF